MMTRPEAKASGFFKQINSAFALANQTKWLY